MTTSVFTTAFFDSFKKVSAVYEKPKTPFQARSIFPVETVGKQEVLFGYRYKIFNQRSIAGLVAEGATKYPTMTKGTGIEYIVQVSKFGIEKPYTQEEMDRFAQAQMMNGSNVPMQFAPQDVTSMFDAHEVSHETLVWKGSNAVEQLANFGEYKSSLDINPTVKGILFDDGSHIDVEANGIGSTNAGKRAWENKDPKQILQDITIAKNKILKDTNNSVDADTLVFSVTMYTHLENTDFKDFGDMSILDKIKGLGLNVVKSSFLEKENTDNIERFIIFKKDPSIVSIILPQNYVQALPIEQEKDIYTAAVKSYGFGIVKKQKGIDIYKGI